MAMQAFGISNTLFLFVIVIFQKLRIYLQCPLSEFKRSETEKFDAGFNGKLPERSRS